MDVELVLKVAGVGMLVAGSSQILQRSGRDEQALLLSLSGVVFVLLILIGKIGELFDTITTLFGL